MIAHVYQIKRDHSKKEIIAQRKKLALFSTLMHTTSTCTIMATALQNSLCIPCVIPPQRIQKWTIRNAKFQYYRKIDQYGT